MKKIRQVGILILSLSLAFCAVACGADGGMKSEVTAEAEVAVAPEEAVSEHETSAESTAEADGGVKSEVTAETETKAESKTKVEAETKLDTTPPVISGAEDKTAYIGGSISYKKGVEVVDDKDPNPQLTVDNSAVNMSAVGVYPVTYIATDSSGNSSSVTINIQVVVDTSISDDQIEAMCDEICNAIIQVGTSDSEKIHAVFDFVLDIGYAPVCYAPFEEYKINAYYYYNTRVGNCNCSCALAKVLLDYLGYGNFFVTNNREEEDRHIWNFVTVDGENWYHFDALERPFDTGDIDVCMVTDAWLDAYCEEFPHFVQWYDRTEETCPRTSEVPFE